MRSKQVRIRIEAYDLYKQVAEEEGLVLSDLLSCVLLEAVHNPAVVATALEWAYGMSKEEAWRVANKLLDRLCELKELIRLRGVVE